MDIKPIHSKADYKAAMKAIAALVASDPELGTPDGDRLDTDSSAGRKGLTAL